MRRQLRPRPREQLDIADDLDAGLAGALSDGVAVERQAGGDDEGVELAEVGLVQVRDFCSPAKAGVRFLTLIWTPAFAGEQSGSPTR